MKIVCKMTMGQFCIIRILYFIKNFVNKSAREEFYQLARVEKWRMKKKITNERLYV